MDEVDEFADPNGGVKDPLRDGGVDRRNPSPIEEDDFEYEEKTKDGNHPELEEITTNIGAPYPQSAPTYDMTLLNQRIRDSLLILGDFKTRAPPGLTRKACVNSLLNDLCQRYSYSRFMMNLLYDLFPKEVII